ncbi:MAG TPA: hypothetical protein VN577_23720 [Terriglobales bacterium]|nr:hypothetical protein [Terriglobales bacterium]
MPNRREFLRISGLSAAGLALSSSASADASRARELVLIVDVQDQLASSAPVQTAIRTLLAELQARQIAVTKLDSLPASPAGPIVIIASHDNRLAAPILSRHRLTVPTKAESLVLAPSAHRDATVTLATARDPRGLMYAVLELADRVRYSDDPIDDLTIAKPLVEDPYNAVRSIGRPFVSNVEDKPWFYDREMWPAYFSMLATNRVNRLHFAVGISHDALTRVSDAYFLFAYPFFLSVPGFSVRATNLPDEERDRNLDTLKFISHEAAAHGIDFQLGIWTHGTRWTDSPNPNHIIEGITPENHVSYCREALALLLQSCPDIIGVTIRTHDESGVKEGSIGFWETVFDGVSRSGHKIEIDLHSKGLDDRLISAARRTNMPLMISPKFWAEHMGLPYHQAAIREMEAPTERTNLEAYYGMSTGSRLFTRYGYANFLREDRDYRVMHRIWAGTHRMLLWGDPVSNAAYSRAFRFCGSDGVELFEPLAFKGRRGSGLPGGRCAYADTSLNPRWDWQKFLYTYRTWGRLLYNPDCDSDVWRRQLRTDFGPAAPSIENAFASASRLLPIITVAHLPSAANDTYSPEFYTNQSIADPNARSPFGDTPSPKVFGNVSPLDPQLFSRMNDFADDLLAGEQSAKYSPVEVAQWIDSHASTAAKHLVAAESNTAELRRASADIAIQIGIARFFAEKFRAAVLYGIHERTGDTFALQEAINAYKRARDHWSAFANGPARVYVSDITIGPLPHQRGHWLDRLPAIDADIQYLERLLAEAEPIHSPEAKLAVDAVLTPSPRIPIACTHIAPPSFIPGKPLDLHLQTAAREARIFYRHVNQGERYQSAGMTRSANNFAFTIPASYTDSPFPLEYYFELRNAKHHAVLYPGFAPDLMNQPYFVIRQRNAPKHPRSPGATMK